MGVFQRQAFSEMSFVCRSGMEWLKKKSFRSRESWGPKLSRLPFAEEPAPRFEFSHDTIKAVSNCAICGCLDCGRGLRLAAGDAPGFCRKKTGSLADRLVFPGGKFPNAVGLKAQDGE